MKRKILIYAICLLNIFSSFSLKGQYIVPRGQNYYSAGPSSDQFQYFAVQQRSMNWCWAACIQMVLTWDGLPVTQEQVVQRCYGQIIDHTGSPYDILNALNGWGYDSHGRIRYIYANSYQTSADEIQNYLSRGWPLIVSLKQSESNIDHARVLSAIYYSCYYDYYGNLHVNPDYVVLRDPWPYNPSRQEMSWWEFSNRITACYKVWVTQ